MFLQRFVPDWKNVHVLVKVLRRTIVVVVVGLVDKIMIVFRVEVELLKLCDMFKIFGQIFSGGVALETRLGVSEHEFFEEAFGVDFLKVSEDGFLFGKRDVHEMFFKIAS